MRVRPLTTLLIGGFHLRKVPVLGDVPLPLALRGFPLLAARRLVREAVLVRRALGGEEEVA